MIHTGDAIEVMAGMPADSVDAVVTDPPYALAFMSKKWDAHPSPRSFMEWCTEWGGEALRVTKPGGYLLAFGGTRTHHRLVCGLEDAGWIIRDELDWIFASGFPKSLDVGKAMDKRGGTDISWFGPWLREERERRGITQKSLAVHFPSKTNNLTGCVANWELGFNLPTVEQFNKLCEVLELPFSRIEEAERAVVGTNRSGPATVAFARQGSDEFNVTAASSELARKWDGWGTALKPAHEPIVLARKPLIGSVAANVTRYGTGALNIGATRIGGPDGHGGGARWPSNLLLSDPELFDEPNPEVVGSGATAVSGWRNGDRPDGAVGIADSFGAADVTGPHYEDRGGYSRFFIIPKADRTDREPVVRGQLGERVWTDGREIPADYPSQRGKTALENAHPTVKPVDLMRHLIRLVTPSGGTVLDCFAGSGSTLIAAELEGFPWIGIEKEPEYVAIAEARLNGTQRGLGLSA